MAELDLGGRNYYDVLNEISGVSEDLLRHGADASAALGAIEHFDKPVVSQMDEEQFARFCGNIVWSAATAVIDDLDADPTHAYDLLTKPMHDSLAMGHALALVEFGKDLDKSHPRSERAHKVLRMSSDAVAEAWDSIQDRPLNQRIAFYTDKYTRVASLQDWAGDQEGEAITAERIVDAGESLLKEARQTGDEILADEMNESLRELAGSLSGGIENPKAQRLLRLTSAEQKRTFDYIELQKLRQTADTLLKSGMIDTAFGVYKLTSNFDADKARDEMQKRGDMRSEKEMEEHIRLVSGSFPGSPWKAILELQQQPDTEEYVEKILDRIRDEYPTTYEWFSFGQYLSDHAAYDVLINAGRSKELAEIVRGNAREEEAPNLRFMAGRMAVMIILAGKQELYDQVAALTSDVPGASKSLQAGRDAAQKISNGQ